ncbi:DUF6602 domain-containing protein [Cryobacterium sp. PH31-L1]|uniref:DUF6602 domain-containing protein n=1 Tax=Cryobacterium sp. PH31-L1 TaxID=3046199 RepID=UPI0024B8D5CE|nr:DUF6602 domain-containing protein [Cryobacterium sp. PH31-L1]MDJ0379079.1 hypothetical protein [Cryobacterium sp. PH31-L1]
MEQYWAGIGHWLQIQAESFNRLIEHNGEKGRANELTVADFLARLLPPNLGIGSGIILDREGKQSRQCDLIVHEVHKHPQLFSQTSQFVFPADTVVMTVEVKTTLDASEVEKIGKNTESVRAAHRAQADTKPPLVAVFAFSTSASPHTTLSWFKTLLPGQRPDLVCVVNPGILYAIAAVEMVGECVLLHRKDVDRNRISMTWQTVEDHQSATLVDGVSYPVAMVRSSIGSSRSVFEPGRALLLFSVRVLAALGERGSLGTAWWESYLDALTRETEQIKHVA